MKSSSLNLCFGLLFISAVALLLDSATAVDIPCDDWESYKDEKCYKVFDKSGGQTFAEAHQFCSEQGGQLLAITSRQKQAFLADFLLNRNHLAENLWLGAEYYTGSEQRWSWENGRAVTFSNWISGARKDEKEHCAEFHIEAGANAGKWSSEPCGKKNLAVCQKNPVLSEARIASLLIDAKEELEGLESASEDLQQRLIPIGFIYVQLPKQQSPVDIWPTFKWTEVSALYEGVFFRVSGGEAGAFGSIQEPFAPHIDQLEHTFCTFRPNNTCDKLSLNNLIDVPVAGGWSDFVYTTDKYTYDDQIERLDIDGLKVHRVGGEVRPKNMAVKVWSRSA